MRRTIVTMLLGLGLAVGAGAGHAAETVHSLAAVPGALHTPAAQQAYAQQIAGAPAPDLLGLRLPAGLTPGVLAGLLRPAGDTAPLNAVGARALPGAPGRFIAILCTGGDLPTTKYDTRCAGSPGDKPPLHAVIGLIAFAPETPPRLLARSASTAARVNWGDTHLSDGPETRSSDAAGRIAPDTIGAFDLAPYRITPHQRAYGLRVGWMEGYSGGMASYQALLLFARHGKALSLVLAVPMSSYKDLAGDWHKNGTRDHQISEAEMVLIVLGHQSGGYFDLRLKRPHAGWHRDYHWSAATGRYVPAGPWRR